MALGLLISASLLAQSVSEYQVKAAYLYNFAKATEWPAQALPPDSRLIFCIVGGDEEFVRVLRDSLSSKSLNGHLTEVRHVRSTDELGFCHVAFVRAGSAANSGSLRQLGRSNVLLVGEEANFLSKGGMVNLMLRDGRISYEVSSEPEDSTLHYGVSARAPAQAVIESTGARTVKAHFLPTYPAVARGLNLKGTVQLQAVVRADGVVKAVNVIGGHPMLAAAASDAVMKWRFQSGPRETTETVKITFGN
jgi:TonB family protein